MAPDVASTIQARISPVDLAVHDTKGSSNEYVYAEHLEKLNHKLLDVADGKIKRLAVFMPPRHGKSELISKYFPAWYLGTHPDKRVILCSYEADFAAGWGQKVRDLLVEYNNIYGVNINDGSAARNRWDLSGYTGGMVTAGVGGPITGKGASLLIIDDPVKNAEQANSPTYREKAKDWYRSTAYTRLEPNGAVIVIQTRWHEDDLGGWLLSESEEDWDVLSLPAINENNEPLWPDRFSYDRLMEIKRELGSYWFSAMYQQNPQPAEGGLLKRNWIQYYDKLPGSATNHVTYTGWDLAISQKETADYTCSCTIRKDNLTGNLFVVDWTRDHLTFPEQQQAVLNQHQRWGSDLIGIENVAYQDALPQSLKSHMLPIKGVKPLRDKVTKIISTFTLFEQGIVYLPSKHPLLGEFENEYTYFPTGKHDDLLDATEMALSLAIQGVNPYTSEGPAYEFSDYGRRDRGRPKHMYL